MPNASVSPAVSQRLQNIENIHHWPTEEDAHAMLDIVVLNVGISQQLFDARVFSDNLSILYDKDSPSEPELPELCIVECLLVFAIGRLLQAHWDDTSEVPGQDFFDKALKRIPDLGRLRGHGILGIELMGLCALYLQVSDRKDEAYLYVGLVLCFKLSPSVVIPVQAADIPSRQA